MKFTKVFFSVLAFAFFLFNGTADAQLNVQANGEVAIGINSTIAKLRVYNNAETYSSYLTNAYNTNSSKYGIYNTVSSTGTGARYGFYQTTYSNSSSTSLNRGIYSYVSNGGSGDSYGLYASVSSLGSGTKYGVYATASSGYAGYFVGDVVVDGSFQIMLMAPNPTSKMAPIANVTDKIKGLNTFASTNKNAETEYGFDEASFRAAFPELVKETPRPADEMVPEEEGAEPVMTSKASTVATVDYSSLLPVLVEALKEQQLQIEMLENQIKEIQANR